MPHKVHGSLDRSTRCLWPLKPSIPVRQPCVTHAVHTRFGLLMQAQIGPKAYLDYERDQVVLTYDQTASVSDLEGLCCVLQQKIAVSIRVVQECIRDQVVGNDVVGVGRREGTVRNDDIVVSDIEDLTCDPDGWVEGWTIRVEGVRDDEGRVSVAVGVTCLYGLKNVRKESPMKRKDARITALCAYLNSEGKRAGPGQRRQVK